jgi:hypothetical protein
MYGIRSKIRVASFGTYCRVLGLVPWGPSAPHPAPLSISDADPRHTGRGVRTLGLAVTGVPYPTASRRVQGE